MNAQNLTAVCVQCLQPKFVLNDADGRCYGCRTSARPAFNPQPVGAGDGSTVIPRYVTEEDVRRIVQEELSKLQR